MKPAQVDLFAAPKSSPKKARALIASATRRQKKPREAPAPKPWQCAILAVDTAANSGWSIWREGQLVSHCEVDTRDELEMRLVLADISLWAETTLDCERGRVPAVPAVLVLEAPYGGFKHPGMVSTLVALGMARERWERAWKARGLPMSHIVRVQPSTWRAAVLGRVARMKTEELRKLEQSVACRLLGCAEGRLGSDEAAAVCIGAWATRAPEVGRVIGERARKASERAWEGKV